MPRLYYGSRGGLYYKRKGRKVYVNRFSQEIRKNLEDIKDIPEIVKYNQMSDSDLMDKNLGLLHMQFTDFMNSDTSNSIIIDNIRILNFLTPKKREQLQASIRNKGGTFSPGYHNGICEKFGTEICNEYEDAWNYDGWKPYENAKDKETFLKKYYYEANKKNHF